MISGKRNISVWPWQLYCKRSEKNMWLLLDTNRMSYGKSNGTIRFDLGEPWKVKKQGHPKCLVVWDPYGIDICYTVYYHLNLDVTKKCCWWVEFSAVSAVVLVSFLLFLVYYRGPYKLKTPPLNNSLHLKTSHLWHPFCIIKLKITPF